MPAALLTRDEVVDRLLAAFRDRGYDGASLSDLSAATGLGRSSLYHHFPGGKQDMGRAVLTRLEALLEASVLAALRGEGTPAERLDAMLAVVDTFYEGGRRACLLERLTASVEREAFARPLQHAFAAWIGALAALAMEAGFAPDEARARAEDAVVRVEGALVVCAGTGGLDVFARALARVRGEFFR